MRLSRGLFLVLIIAAPPLAGHDLYILPERFVVMPHDALLVAFHNGDSFPLSEVSPSIARIRDTNLISAGGLVAMQDLKIDGKRAIATANAPAAGEFLLTIRTIPNLLVSTPAQFLSYLKEEGLDHVRDWRERHGEAEKPARERYRKYAKSLLVAGKTDGFFSHQVEFPIEIIPESDPYFAKTGDALKLRVVFKGKPAPGLQMEVAWAGQGQNKTTIAGRTDQNGTISIKLEKPGLFRLHTLVMEPCTETAIADWESSWASLTFELR
jgi:Domain of unknown function (DUF4198)